MIRAKGVSGVQRITLLMNVTFSLVMSIKLKVFLEEMSDQTIEITPYNIAFYYVFYCTQNKIKVNESKIDNYVERMQQPLISDSVKEDFKKIIYDHAKSFTKNKLSTASHNV